MQPEISHRCASCGASIREPGMFCPECGKALAPVEPAAGPKTAPTDPVTDKNQTDQSVEQASKPGTRERTRERLHRASTAASSVARGALEDNVKRVEKIHHVSTAMIEEATYDPSLRFVLVALGLFIIFVILLVLSKVMG